SDLGAEPPAHHQPARTPPPAVRVTAHAWMRSSVLVRANASLRFQPRDGPGARPEGVDLHAELTKHHDIEVTQRLVIRTIEGQVLTVFEPAARKQDWQVIHGMVTAAHVAAHQDHRPIEKGFPFLARVLELAEKLPHGLEFVRLDDAQLPQLLRVLAVM